MGFGFNMLMALLVLPLTVLLVIISAVSRNSITNQTFVALWLGIGGLVLLVSFLNLFTGTTTVSRNNIYGEYVIDRSKFPGANADWQYNHFRFEITDDDSVHFHVTDSRRIIRTYNGTVRFLSQYKATRLIINIDTPRHHIIEGMPTLYREHRSFYYTFKSPYYGNVFFTQGEWKPIE